MNSILTSVATTFLLLVLFYLAKNYFPGYFGEKGKNQATKEDIGHITEIVEKIKSDLSQQNEFLKAQLSFSNQHRLNIKSAEREALFKFNAQISAWIYSVLRFSLFRYGLENYKDLKLVSSDFVKRQYDCDLAEAHLELFMHDDEFLQLKKDLNVSIIKLQKATETAIIRVHAHFSQCEFDIEAVRGNAGEESKTRGKYLIAVEPLYKAYADDSIKEFEKVNRLHSAMVKLIHKRLEILESSYL